METITEKCPVEYQWMSCTIQEGAAIQVGECQIGGAICSREYDLLTVAAIYDAEMGNRIGQIGDFKIILKCALSLARHIAEQEWYTKVLYEIEPDRYSAFLSEPIAIYIPPYPKWQPIFPFDVTGIGYVSLWTVAERKIAGSLIVHFALSNRQVEWQDIEGQIRPKLIREKKEL